MKNITEILKKAILSNVNWAHSVFYLAIDTLKDKSVEVSFWEDEENWASILINNKTVGYIWKKYPLVIFEKKAIPNFKMLLKEIEQINYIEVDSLSDDLFRLEDDSLKAYFDNFFDFNSFTMENLWFNTNSV